jgi:hypothetical protein
MVPKLSNLIGTASFNQTVKNNSSSDLKTFSTIANVMRELNKDRLITGLSYNNDLNSQSFNRSLGDSAIHYLGQLRAAYKDLYRDAESRKDHITSTLVANLGQEGLIKMKQMHYNSSLASIVTNQNIDNSIVQAGDHYLVKVAPVFRLPESRIGRAQFYAPSKVIGNLEISTYNFNVMIISLMILLLYISLYYDWLKKTVSFTGNLKLQFR